MQPVLAPRLWLLAQALAQRVLARRPGEEAFGQRAKVEPGPPVTMAAAARGDLSQARRGPAGCTRPL